jgi:hypothetical protein
VAIAGKVILTAQQVRDIKEHPRTYGSRLELAERYGVPPHTITTARDRTGTGDMIGGRSRAKLTDDQVRKIKAWPKSYGYRKTLSGMFGVAPATITAIRCGKSWGHI